MTATITMRYYNQSSKAEDKLTRILKTFKNIKSIKFPEPVIEDTKGTTTMKQEKTVSFSYTGSWKGLVDIEKRTIKEGLPAALLSHAYVAIAILPRKGFNKDGIRASLNELPGMKYVCCVNQTFADFYMDINEVDAETLIKTATDNKAKAKSLTHETVVLTIKEGTNVKSFVRDLLTTMKVLLVIQEGETVTVKSLLSLNNEKYRRIAQKSGIKLGKIKRKS